MNCLLSYSNCSQDFLRAKILSSEEYSIYFFFLPSFYFLFYSFIKFISELYEKSLLGDPQHRAFLPSPPLCPRLSTSHLTVHILACQLTVNSSSPHHCFTSLVAVIVPPLYCHLYFRCPIFSVFAYILSVTVLTSLFSSFMVPLLFINPDISASLFIYLPFPSRDPHLFLFWSPAR